MFPQFDSLPDHLRLQVIQKLNSYSYIRYRQTNSDANEFCSKYTSFIRIRLRKNARLYLLDSYADLIAFGTLADADINVEGIQAMVDYGTHRTKANLRLPMTFENISVLHKSIQGFHFDEIVVWNCRHYMTPSENRTFQHALALFLSAIRHLRSPWITVRNVSRVGLEELATRLRPKSLTLSKIELTKADIRLAEKMTYEIYLDFVEFPEKLDLVKICKNKKIISLQNTEGIFPEVFWNVFENLIKCWKIDTIPLQDGLLIFGDNGNFMDEDLSLPKSRFSSHGAFHLGSYEAVNVQNLFQRSGGLAVPLKYDYFLMQCGEDKWIVFYLRRSKSSSVTTVRMGFTNLTRKPCRPEEYVAKIVKHLFRKAVVDFSLIREQLEVETTLEGKKKKLEDFIDHIVSFYTPPPPELPRIIVDQ